MAELRKLIKTGVAGVRHIPLCQYCLLERVKQKSEYDFMDINHVWSYACRPHWSKNRLTKELGTGFAVRLVKYV